MIMGLTLGGGVGVTALVMAVRSSAVAAGIISLLIAVLAGLVGGIWGVLIVTPFLLAVVFSYGYEDKQDPFTSRAALDEVDFEESNVEFALRQAAAFGRGVRAIARIVMRNKVGFAGLIGVLFFVLLLGLGPLFIEYEGRAQMQRLQPGSQTLFQPPSSEHILGLDHRGRDILSHIVYGGQKPIFTSIQAALLSTVIAVGIGAVAALVGGWLDQVLLSLANFIVAVPLFPILLVLSTIFTLNSNVALIWILAVFTWPSLMRSVRAQVLSLRERDYVEASFALDLGMFHIITREVFPNLVSYIAVNFILSIRAIMYSIIGLILVGVVPFQEPDWAAMIGSSRTYGAFYSRDGYTMALAPMLAIALFQLSLVLFARSLEEIFNPRLRTLE